LLSAGDFDFISGYSNGLLIFTITLCYSVMAPLISVFGFIFFALTLLIDGYNLHRATEQRWQGGGKAFSFVLHHLMISFITFQVVMIGILSLSEYAGSVALVPLPFLTIALWFILHFGWSHVINYGPLDCAASEASWRDSIGEARMVHAYRQPAFVPLDHELEALEEATDAGSSEGLAKEETFYDQKNEKSLSAEFEAQHMRFYPESDEVEAAGEALGLTVPKDR
jgi:energy-coupling factor transporter transmembrane protein EcfT